MNSLVLSITVIGTVGCFEVAHTDRCMEFGVAISEEHWREGVATEAGREVINYAFSHFDVARLQFRCAPENSASLALAKCLGFQEEGILRNVVWCKGRFWSMNYLSMLREDWNRGLYAQDPNASIRIPTMLVFMVTCEI